MARGEAAFRVAHVTALLVPFALLGGALISQYVGGLYPCEMCYWQRWPHGTALVLATLALVIPQGGAKRALVLLAGIAILISGLIGVFHAGVEYGWWEGLTTCSTNVGGEGSAEDLLTAIMDAPVIRCDQTQWELFGISLAGFNFIFSVAGALMVFMALGRASKA
jgi:disulfide bond formation protein DsbB